MDDRPVSLDQPVEEIVERYPSASGFLLQRGVVCIRCGEPAWCSLGELIAEKGGDAEIIVSDLNKFLLGAGSASDPRKR